jgi:preprotein translocase subunit SecG
MKTLPDDILPIIEPFRKAFLQKRTWVLAKFLLIGLILLKGGRTICRILRFMGLKAEKKFDKYHKLLNRSRWDLLKASKIALDQIISNIPTDQTVYIAVDEHLERRRGSKISAIGCYRDPVLSTKKCKVKSYGLKWLTVMVLTKFTWSKKIFALPFLTILTKSVEGDLKSNTIHKTPTDWMCQLTIQIRRWLPQRRIVIVTDGGLASSEFGWTSLRLNVNWVTRLQYNARLYDFPEKKQGRGRPSKKGKRLLNPKEIHECSGINWQEMDVKWYGGEEKKINYITFTCMRHTETSAPFPIRVVALKDPKGEFEPITLMGVSKDCSLTAKEMIESFVQRWNQEVTHREVREHLGVETQRQWSDNAIKRCTPVLFTLYTLILLMADKLNSTNELKPLETAWYKKTHVTFSDALTMVRKILWKETNFKLVHNISPPIKNIEINQFSALWDYLAEAV